MPESEVRRRFEEALAVFVERVKQDTYIVAAILLGSLAYDEVWEKSDIDILLIGRDDKIADKIYSLVEHGINIHVDLVPRRKFKERMERALHGTFSHSVLSRSTLLFATDESIRDYYENVYHVGSRDREMQLLRVATYTLPALTKAEKWLEVKHDPIYSFLWIMYVVNSLATLEVLYHADVPGREVIWQAMAYNPGFFKAVYHDLIQQHKDEDVVRLVLDLIKHYLDERLETLFGPILSYLRDAGGLRSSSEIDEHFRKRAQVDSLCVAYEWLAEKGIIQQLSTPLRLTEKSKVTVNEAAYYYDGGDHDHAY